MPGAFDVVAESLNNHDEVRSILRATKWQEPVLASVALEVEPDEYTIDFDFERPLVLRGGSISVRESLLDAADYGTLLRRFVAYVDDVENQSLERSAVLTEIERLCADQLQRTKAKAVQHEPGTTARTLYDHQISFILRLLEVHNKRV
ncbi:MAG TPA: hypothetical protein VJR24_07165 [Gemmatimonadaceae bacterium]|nr:hypothetical protein [Gemmatimonadaceae bacterium]